MLFLNENRIHLNEFYNTGRNIFQIRKTYQKKRIGNDIACFFLFTLPFKNFADEQKLFNISIKKIKLKTRIYFKSILNISSSSLDCNLNANVLEGCKINKSFEIDYKLHLPHNNAVNVVAYYSNYTINK